MRKLSLLPVLLSTVFVIGCTTEPSDLAEEGALEAASSDEGKADSLSIQFKPIDDPAGIGSRGQTETRRVFTSQASYVAYFGHKAPATVNFNNNEWVVFYSAGVKNTGGYQASIDTLALSRSGLTLKVTTALESPGPDCPVTQSLTKPYTLAKFPYQPSAYYAHYYTNDSIRDCSRTCSQNVLCVIGSHFDNTPGVCKCVPDTATGACNADSDCELIDNYCGGCHCDALGPGLPKPECSNPVQCLRQPCGGLVGKCQNHQCVAVTAPPAGVACGKNTCAAGQYCCNASCGICAAPGVFCIQIACTN